MQMQHGFNYMEILFYLFNLFIFIFIHINILWYTSTYSLKSSDNNDDRSSDNNDYHRIIHMPFSPICYHAIDVQVNYNCCLHCT